MNKRNNSKCQELQLFAFFWRVNEKINITLIRLL